MNQSFTLRHKAGLVGIFVSVAGLIVFGVLLYFAQKALFQAEYTLITVFSKGTGLQRGSPVTLQGYAIGTIAKVDLNDKGKICLSLKIKSKYQPRIRTNSVATIERLNIAVGDKFITITQGSPDKKVLEDGDTLRGADPFELEDATVHLSRITADLEELIGRMKRGEGSIGALLNDRSTVDSLNRLLHSGHRVMQNGNRLVGGLNRLTHDANEVVVSLPALIEKTSRMADDADTLLERADTLLQQIAQLLGGFEPIVEEGESSMYQASDIMSSIKKNWLIRRNLPKEKLDCIILEETRE